MRTLGSFNRQVNIPSHPEDREPPGAGTSAKHPLARGGYDMGIHRSTNPEDTPSATGEEKFASGRGRSRRRKPEMRMAGQALDADLKRGSGLQQAFAQPMMGSAELRTPDLPQ
jgi:hypothetical protein